MSLLNPRLRRPLVAATIAAPAPRKDEKLETIRKTANEIASLARAELALIREQADNNVHYGQLLHLGSGERETGIRLAVWSEIAFKDYRKRETANVRFVVYSNNDGAEIAAYDDWTSSQEVIAHMRKMADTTEGYEALVWEYAHDHFTR